MESSGNRRMGSCVSLIRCMGTQGPLDMRAYHQCTYTHMGRVIEWPPKPLAMARANALMISQGHI